jgi:hypothetical protein
MMDDRAIRQAVQDGEDEANGVTPTSRALVSGLNMIASGDNQGDFDFSTDLRGAEGVRLTLTFNNRAERDADKIITTIDIPTSGDVIVEGVNLSKQPKDGIEKGQIPVRTYDLPTHEETVVALIKQVSREATACHRQAKAKRFADSGASMSWSFKNF